MADTRVDELRRRLERDPGSRLFAQLAEELRKSGELPEAIRVARAGLAVHAAYPSARLTLGRALLDSGDPEAAREELESALKDAPDNILASRYLAQAREALGDLTGAAEQYRRTLLMAPEDRQLQSALQAVEAKLGAPLTARETLAGTTQPRRSPPPLPHVAGVSTTTLPRIAAPEAPTAAPSPPAGLPRDSPASASGAGVTPPQTEEPLPPTLRLRGAQVDFVAPPAPASHAVAAPEVAGPGRAARPAPAPPLASVPPAPDAAAGAVEPGMLVEGSDGTAAVAAEAESPAGVPGAPLSSSTLGELYLQQGLADRAVEVYRQVVQQEPGNEKARRRLAELEAGIGDRAVRRRALERTIASLEQLLGAVRRR